MRITVPTWWSCSQVASSMSSSSWAATASRRSPEGRSSSSWSERGRPTWSGTRTWGYTTAFFRGSTGSRRVLAAGMELSLARQDHGAEQDGEQAGVWLGSLGLLEVEQVRRAALHERDERLEAAGFELIAVEHVGGIADLG